MMDNINTKHFWEERFSSGDWIERGGEDQTRGFAESQIEHFDIQRDFDGTILDFGCALGNSMPVYRQAYPNAKLIGLDFSEHAIAAGRNKYGEFADFICGDTASVPEVDVIIASNVFEHLSNDIEIAKQLFRRCETLYIIVPYKEELVPNDQHVNSYDEGYFSQIEARCESKVFLSAGWTQYGFKLLYEVYFKNIIRLLVLRKPRQRAKQIMFKLTHL
jgi:hypothetical protein